MFHSYFFVLVLLLFVPLGWVVFPLSVDLGGDAQCLNSGPSSEPGVNRGLGSLFWGMLVIYFIFSFLFRCVLDLLPLNRLKVTNCPGHSSALYHTGSPYFSWPLASSGSRSIATWFRRPRPLAFYDPGHFRASNIHGESYVWQNLISNSSCGEVDLLEIIREGVRVEHFFKPFRGSFKGKAYDSDIPPPVVINNFATCARFFPVH